MQAQNFTPSVEKYVCRSKAVKKWPSEIIPQAPSVEILFACKNPKHAGFNEVEYLPMKNRKIQCKKGRVI